ncbi:MAG: WYL domain-containing protein, partial [Clostridia bacterium]|nr:WYL domain-containing protein [Clostridia bacterium]
VRLRFRNELANVVIDRFGKEVILAPDGEDHFTVNVEVSVSPQFMAWVFGLGSGVEILWPADVRQQMAERLKEMLGLYE